jgi:ribosomal protein S17E
MPEVHDNKLKNLNTKIAGYCSDYIEKNKKENKMNSKKILILIFQKITCTAHIGKY